MVKYHCEYCKRDLFHSKLSGRIMHNNGQKHNMNKKTYFLELFENNKIKKELNSIYDQFRLEKYSLFTNGERNS